MKTPRIRLNRELGLGLLTVAMIATLGLRWPQFATTASLRSAFDDTAILILLALGQMLVIVTRGIDLSVAANLALTGMVVALINFAHPQVPVLLLAALAMLLGAALGLFNGLLVWRLSLPPIVVTLGSMAIFRGLVYIVSGGVWVTSDKMSEGFQAAVRTPWLGLSTLSWLAILGSLAAFSWVRYSRSGRRLYLVGSNPAAAAYVGIAPGRAQCVAFTLSGLMAGLCGYLWVARFAVAYTDVATGFELQVIAACVIGGVSINGGAGSVPGVLLGCLFLGVIRNALPLIGISPFWQMAVSGLVITIAVVLNERGRGKQHQRILERSDA